MQTEPAKPPPPERIETNLLETGETPSRQDEASASMETKIAAVEDKLLEERFCWTVALVVFVNAYIFTQMSNWAGAFVIGALELIGLVVWADRCKVNTVLPLIDRLAGFTNGSRNDDNE